MAEGAETSEGCVNRAQGAPVHALPPNARFLGSDCALWLRANWLFGPILPIRRQALHLLVKEVGAVQEEVQRQTPVHLQ